MKLVKLNDFLVIGALQKSDRISHYPNQEIIVINKFLHLPPIGLVWHFPLPPPKNARGDDYLHTKRGSIIF